MNTLPAITVANYFVQKGLDENDRELTPMKVLKLSYIAHGWHLALFDAPLLAESPQAWQYGPVIPSIYRAFKPYGNQTITAPYFNGETITNPQTLKFLNRIWEVYKGYSGWQLSAITHQAGTPWSIVQAGGYNAPIPDHIIAEHYKQLAQQ